MSDSDQVIDSADPGWFTNDQGWVIWPTIEWLLSKGRLTEDLDELVDALANTLVQSGAPLSRLRLSMRTLHPLIAARTAIWQRGGGTPGQIATPHGLEQRSTHVGSPLAHIANTRRPFRRKLEDGVPAEDHQVLHDLAAEGATDYFGLPMVFSSGKIAMLIFVTDQSGGFADSDLRKFMALASVLAPIAEAQSGKDVALALAETYIGPRTGRRVLEGQITRGDVERVQAAIWFSDIRGWTKLNNQEPPEVVIELANRYFEIVAKAVESNGGEILKLIGDGVLAIFPTQGRQDDRLVCQSALISARQALEASQSKTAPIPLRFGVGLHFGEVFYGNVGSERRLDFTVFGPAVNLAARIEGECAVLGQSLLFSEPFARRISDAAHAVSHQRLKGFDGEFEILTLSGK